MSSINPNNGNHNDSTMSNLATMAGMASTTTTTQNVAASAPEVLLALAKDFRYIQLCQSLLEDVLYWKSDRDMTLCVASILYATTVVLRTGRTLGMEACGLSFAGITGSDNNSSSSSRDNHGAGVAVNPTTTATATTALSKLQQKYKKWHSWSAFVLSALWMHAVKRWATNANNQNNATNIRIGRQMVPNHTASPLGTAQDGINNTTTISSTLSSFSTGTTWLSDGNNRGQESSEEERLRGDARRRFHQQQRQAMLDRAALASQEPPNRGGGSANNNNDANVPAVTSQQQQFLTSRLMQKWKDQVKSLLQALSVPRGPHVIADPNYNDDTYETTLWVWLVRLHLAWFVLNSSGNDGGGEKNSKYGKYPTWMHRIWNLSMIKQDPTAPSRVVERPTSVRIVGMLIFVQGAATLIQTMTIRSIEFWMKRQQRIRLGQGRHTQQRLLARFLGKLFGRSTLLSSAAAAQPQVPRVLHAQVEDEELNESEDEVTSSATMSTSNVTSSSSSSVACGICHNKRTHPAASVTCGHVFCWKCLYHWVSSVRPECPLCRSSCRPQDLIALHHYSPAQTEERS